MSLGQTEDGADRVVRQAEPDAPGTPVDPGMTAGSSPPDTRRSRRLRNLPASWVVLVDAVNIALAIFIAYQARRGLDVFQGPAMSGRSSPLLPSRCGRGGCSCC